MEAFMMADVDKAIGNGKYAGVQVVVRYSRGGVGEKTVVLIHGYGQSLEVWEEFAGELGREFDVVSIDLPGSGLSTWGDMEVIEVEFMAGVVSRVMEKLDVREYAVVGHSMGGYVASKLVEIEPERIGGVVMLHSVPMGYGEERKRSVAREIEVIESGKKEMLASTNPNKGFAVGNARKFEERIDEKIEQFMLTPDEALVATLRGLVQRGDTSEGLEKFAKSKPVVVVFGAEDPYIGEEVRAKTEEVVGSAEFVMLENSAHMGFIEEVEKTLEVVKKVMERK